MLKFTSTLRSPFSRPTEDFLRPGSIEMCHVTGILTLTLAIICLRLAQNCFANGIASHNNAPPSFT
jgi:hypothetical protein